jgi:sporulation protein YlmC with PRC-barrel domain
MHQTIRTATCWNLAGVIGLFRYTAPHRRSHRQETDMTTVSGHTSAIRAKKVIGTSVKDPSGATIGKVEDIVLDKLSNNIMFAIVGFGGFLGIGEKYHPLPWSVLDYEESEGGYVVNLTKEQLQAAPAYSMEDLTAGDGTQYRTEVYDYYNAPRYW